ncbi:MAG: 16S rRNA (uracil(1498)-N(3))-methyltransferase [Rhodocyclaceae bacterium]|nr:16S rRNA (uracil(1498)-N(3))-methyltransferase [Rhodocyclaceae bacterium]
MLPRFLVPAGLAPGATVDLPTEAAHHALRVLRLDDGDAVTLFDGRGGEWFARLVRSGPSLRAVLAAFDADDRAPPLAVTLVQGLPAADKMDWIVQKATELGVTAIRPVAAKRSVVKLSGERMERRIHHWQQVAVAACEQCGLNRLPTVAPLLDLPQYLGLAAPQNGLRLWLAPGAAHGLREMTKPAGPVTLLIGPEGGFEEGEARAIQAAGFAPLSLGPRVLRTETAGVAALAAMMAWWGDF